MKARITSTSFGDTVWKESEETQNRKATRSRTTINEVTGEEEKNESEYPQTYIRIHFQEAVPWCRCPFFFSFVFISIQNLKFFAKIPNQIEAKRNW